MSNNESDWKRSEKVSLLMAVIMLGTLLVNTALWYGYYQPTLELNQELAQIVKLQAEKKPVLVLTVYPSSDFVFSRDYSNGTFVFRIENTTLTLRPGSQVTFHIFLSNVGTSPTVVLYLSTVFAYSEFSGSHLTVLNATILKAGESVEWTWRFDVSTEVKEHDIRGSIAFSVTTTDGTTSRVIEIIVNPKTKFD